MLGIISMAYTYRRRLASGVKEDNATGFRTVTSKTGETLTEKITVKQTLRKMGARYVRGKLVDGKRKQIRFYFLQGCWVLG